MDVPTPGCPPRPEALIHAFMTLQQQIQAQRLDSNERPRHLDPDAPSEFPVPRYGAHDLEPPSNPDVWQPPPAATATLRRNYCVDVNNPSSSPSAAVIAFFLVLIVCLLAAIFKCWSISR